MANTRLFDFDPLTKRQTLWHEEDGAYYLETRQDAEPIIEFVKNKAQQPKDEDFHYIGELTPEAFDQAAREGWLHDDKRLMRWFAENPMMSAKYHKA